MPTLEIGSMPFGTDAERMGRAIEIQREKLGIASSVERTWSKEAEEAAQEALRLKRGGGAVAHAHAVMAHIHAGRAMDAAKAGDESGARAHAAFAVEHMGGAVSNAPDAPGMEDSADDVSDSHRRAKSVSGAVRAARGAAGIASAAAGQAHQHDASENAAFDAEDGRSSEGHYRAAAEHANAMKSAP